MALCKAQLLQRLEDPEPETRLVVEPLLSSVEPDEQSAASLDFHLGNRFTVLRRRRAVRHDPANQNGDEAVASEGLFVPMGQSLTLHPGQIVLGATLEYFRLPGDLMAYVVGRSIWGRRGLLIATASAVHPNSAGTVTLELSNVGEVAVVLRPGVAIGQLFFHDVQESQAATGTRRSYYSTMTKPSLSRYKTSTVEAFLLGLGD